MMSAGVALGLVALSMKAATDILRGVEVPQQVRVDLEQITTADLSEQPAFRDISPPRRNANSIRASSRQDERGAGRGGPESLEQIA
jgi:hypothetical protein